MTIKRFLIVIFLALSISSAIGFFAARSSVVLNSNKTGYSAVAAVEETNDVPINYLEDKTQIRISSAQKTAFNTQNDYITQVKGTIAELDETNNRIKLKNSLGEAWINFSPTINGNVVAYDMTKTTYVETDKVSITNDSEKLYTYLQNATKVLLTCRDDTCTEAINIRIFTTE